MLSYNRKSTILEIHFGVKNRFYQSSLSEMDCTTKYSTGKSFVLI